MTATAIRPAWTPLTILLTIIGFVVWWPLGLAMLAYIIWGDRLIEEFKDLKNRMPKSADFGMAGFGSGLGGMAETGNSAFDSYREETMRRLEEERRRLDEEQREFHEFLRNLRKARDQEEFDRFMAERRRAS